MTEIRVRPRQVLLLVVIFGLILWYVSTRTNNCNHLTDNFQFSQDTIYAITPTYARPVQKAELTRLSHVVMLVPNIHWIIVEDSNAPSTLVQNLIVRADLGKRSTILYTKTPDEFKLKPKDPNWVKPRGVVQRNLALQWIRKNTPEDDNIKSTVYFMDDDNSYSIELFQEIAKIERGRVGVWPVGLVGGLMVEKPILDSNTNKVIAFNAAWRPDRPFPIDMAGFGISTDLLFKFPTAMFSYEIQLGYQESEILRKLVVRTDLQPLANLCTDILVWHTRTEKTKLTEEQKLLKMGKSSNADMEV